MTKRDESPGDEIPVLVSDTDRQNWLTVILNEHSAMRSTVDMLGGREPALLSALFIVTAGAVPVVDAADPAVRVNLCLFAALITGAIAWVVELQYWDVLWYELYIARVLRPRVVALVSTPSDKDGASVLGFEEFKRSLDDKPKVMIALVLIGSIFYQIVVLAPMVGFLGAAIVVLAIEEVHAGSLFWTLTVASGLNAVMLLGSVFAGYLQANFGISSRDRMRSRSR